MYDGRNNTNYVKNQLNQMASHNCMTVQTLMYIQRTLSTNESQGRRETPSDVLLQRTPFRTPNLGTGSDRPDHWIDPKTAGSLSQNPKPEARN